MKLTKESLIKQIQSKNDNNDTKKKMAKEMVHPIGLNRFCINKNGPKSTTA